MTRYLIQEIGPSGLRRGPVLASVAAVDAEQAMRVFLRRAGNTLSTATILGVVRGSEGTVDTFHS